MPPANESSRFRKRVVPEGRESCPCDRRSITLASMPRQATYGSPSHVSSQRVSNPFRRACFLSSYRQPSSRRLSIVCLRSYATARTSISAFPTSNARAWPRAGSNDGHVTLGGQSTLLSFVSSGFHSPSVTAPETRTGFSSEATKRRRGRCKMFLAKPMKSYLPRETRTSPSPESSRHQDRQPTRTVKWNQCT